MENVKPIASIPRSTYRIQFHKEFPLKQALDLELAEYLKRLGVSYAYSSPLLRARPGSTHGYDVVDHDQLNPEIGNDSHFNDFSSQLRKNGMGLLLDIVPNHVGIAHPTSKWWFDVLEHGRGSKFANHFDINWDASEHNGRLMVACLGSPLGTCIDNGELKVVFVEENPLASENNKEDPKLGSFQLHYYSNPFAVDPTTLLKYVFEPALQSNQGNTTLSSIVEELKKIPHRDSIGKLDEESQRSREKRYKDCLEIKKRISDAMTNDKSFREVIEKSLKNLNGEKGNTSSLENLHRFIEEQPYRLTYWKAANDELNYRRFFDINELMAIKTERDQVFDDSHRLVFQWVKEGRVNGLRLDHPDGLFDPVGYTRKLQVEVSKHLPKDFQKDDPSGKTPFYILIEKILEPGEALSHDWNVHGTVGYDYMNVLNDVFVEKDNEKAFRDLYKNWGRKVNQPFEELLYNCKKLIVNSSMETELNSVSRVLFQVARSHKSSKDFSFKSIKLALAEFVAHFPVYRTYITSQTTKVDENDSKFIQTTIDLVKSKSISVDPLLVGFISDILFLKGEDKISKEEVEKRRYFISKFQQITGPVMAKGLEDTSFYRFFLLTSLNEVGGNPDCFGISTEEFHKTNENRAKEWLSALSGTSTHDTKRSEDVRSRINVLSEIPELWGKTAKRWSQLNEKHKSQVDGLGAVPEPNEEYMIYQTLVGVWPFGLESADKELVERLTNYLMKAIREAKLRTTWTQTNQPYEDSFKSFVEKVTKDSEFLKEFLTFQKKVSELGKLNSLSQTVLKLTCPGVPDVYQGTEVWSLSLVDPDNRRPVDYNTNKKLLERIESQSDNIEGLVKSLYKNSDDGGIKLFTTKTLLQLRNQLPEVFMKGDYKPVQVSGGASNHVVAFSREGDGKQVIVVVGRFFSSLLDPQNNLAFQNVEFKDQWKGTTVKLPSRSFQDVLSGSTYSSKGEVDLGEIFKVQPIAVLVSNEAAPSQK